jgi:hypothetical protein
MHQTRASIGSTISQAISGDMLAWLMVQSPAEGLPCAGKCKVNSSNVFAGGWRLQVSRGAKITSHGNRGVLLQRLWRRRGLFKFLAQAPLSWPAHLAYSTVNNLPIHSRQLTTKHTYPSKPLLSKSGDETSHENASSPAQESQDREEDPGQTVRTPKILPPLTAEVLTIILCSSQRIQTGNKVIKPKKAVLVRANTIHKKHTAGLQAVTEKTLAGRAGHLELLRGGKKDRKQSIAGKPTGGKAPKEEKKG